MQHSGRGILLDIEGTTSSIAFVFEVMFPFARRELDLFLVTAWEKPAVLEACQQIARDAGLNSIDDWEPGALDDALRRHVRAEVVRQMESDAKTTGLKQLQGLIWKSGFDSGELKSHVYEDVPQRLSDWKQAGADVRIYSSGSIAAQKLFFGHTIAGDLLARLNGHYDTTTGPKREAASYEKIAAEFALPANEILFLSDIVEELDAAEQAGMKTALVIRPGNKPATPGHHHPQITSFDEIELKVV